MRKLLVVLLIIAILCSTGIAVFMFTDTSAIKTQITSFVDSILSKDNSDDGEKNHTDEITYEIVSSKTDKIYSSREQVMDDLVLVVKDSSGAETEISLDAQGVEVEGLDDASGKHTIFINYSGVQQSVEITIVDVTIKYAVKGKGGNINGECIQMLNSGESTTSVTAVADEGYTFKTWSDGVSNPTRNDVARREYTYYAIFQPLVCSVTFYNESGVRISDILSINYGGSISSSMMPSYTPPESKRFVKWVTITGSDFNFNKVTESVHLVPKLEDITYVISFYDSEKNFISSKTVAKNGAYTLIEAQELTGKDFSGWKAVDNNFSIIPNPSLIAVSDVSYIATYTPKAFRISFYDDMAQSTLLKYEIINYGHKVLNYTPTKENYTFDGWVDEDGVAFDFEKTITSNTAIIATWSEIPRTKYKVTCYDGTTLLYTLNIPEGDTMGQLPEPNAVEGKQFEGYLYSNGNTVLDSDIVNAAVSVYASWSDKIYTVQFINNASVFKKYYIVHGNFVTEEPEITDNYANISGWYDNQNREFDITQPITADATYYCRWNPKKYTITISLPTDVNCNITDGSVYEYGTKVNISFSTIEGARIKKIIVNDSDKTTDFVNNSWTINSISSNYNISVELATNLVTVRNSSYSPDDGDITISNVEDGVRGDSDLKYIMNHKGSLTINVLPKAGLAISRVLVNDEDYAFSSNTITLSSIVVATDVVIEYTEIMYKVSWYVTNSSTVISMTNNAVDAGLVYKIDENNAYYEFSYGTVLKYKLSGYPSSKYSVIIKNSKTLETIYTVPSTRDISGLLPKLSCDISIEFNFG